LPKAAGEKMADWLMSALQRNPRKTAVWHKGVVATPCLTGSNMTNSGQSDKALLGFSTAST
jgi:hypothetical protein